MCVFFGPVKKRRQNLDKVLPPEATETRNGGQAYLRMKVDIKASRFLKAPARLLSAFCLIFLHIFHRLLKITLWSEARIFSFWRDFWLTWNNRGKYEVFRPQSRWFFAPFQRVCCWPTSKSQVTQCDILSLDFPKKHKNPLLITLLSGKVIADVSALRAPALF